jgi:hypothetical protein
MKKGKLTYETPCFILLDEHKSFKQRGGLTNTRINIISYGISCWFNIMTSFHVKSANLTKIWTTTNLHSQQLKSQTYWSKWMKKIYKQDLLAPSDHYTNPTISSRTITIIDFSSVLLLHTQKVFFLIFIKFYYVC